MAILCCIYYLGYWLHLREACKTSSSSAPVTCGASCVHISIKQLTYKSPALKELHAAACEFFTFIIFITHGKKLHIGI